MILNMTTGDALYYFVSFWRNSWLQPTQQILPTLVGCILQFLKNVTQRLTFGDKGGTGKGNRHGSWPGGGQNSRGEGEALLSNTDAALGPCSCHFHQGLDHSRPSGKSCVLKKPDPHGSAKVVARGVMLRGIFLPSQLIRQPTFTKQMCVTYSECIVLGFGNTSLRVTNTHKHWTDFMVSLENQTLCCISSLNQ